VQCAGLKVKKELYEILKKLIKKEIKLELLDGKEPVEAFLNEIKLLNSKVLLKNNNNKVKKGFKTKQYNKNKAKGQKQKYNA